MLDMRIYESAKKQATLLAISVAQSVLVAAEFLDVVTSFKEVRQLKKSAEQGDTKACYLLMEYYDAKIIFGKTQKVLWLRRSAELGHVEAAMILGKELIHEAKFDEALDWLVKPTKLGNPLAAENIFSLGIQIYNGVHVKIGKQAGSMRSVPDAIKYWKVAAGFGNEGANKILVECGIRSEDRPNGLAISEAALQAQAPKAGLP